ncbi:MAG: phosphatidylglycerophosphatase A [Rhodovibrionaceae bacterium]|nr:phosphatidylglycerophosphatase A [Rhodovibrionaceae bacterium]
MAVSTGSGAAEALRAQRYRPDVLLVTWFGAGLLPGAPGTWGSLAALPFAYAIALAGGPVALLAASAVLFPIGTFLSDRVMRRIGHADPGQIVIDEVAAQWLSLVPVATQPMFYPVAFIAFRVFDIAKVWPVNILDRRLAGGFGVMADDTVAAIYAGSCTALVALAFGSETCFLTIC